MGLFGRKKDFWDDAEEPVVDESEYKPEEDDQEYPEDEYDDGKWHPTQCVPLKVITRLLLFMAAVVMIVAGCFVYTYFNNGGSLTSKPDYYHSTDFGKEYSRNVEQLIHLLKAIETKGDASEKGKEADNQALIKNYMDVGGNFSFIVYDENGKVVVSSNEDAVERIEASYYFVKLDSTKDQYGAQFGTKNPGYDEEKWKQDLLSCSEKYVIYTGVDNELTSMTDSFYASYLEFSKFVSLFDVAKIAMIAAIVIFILLLIFCIAATGNVKGYAGVRLTWFDRIFTEISALIIIVLAGGCAYGIRYLHTQFASAPYTMVLIAGLCIVMYIIVIRGYFSLVRRIKAGKFVGNMIFYRIFEAFDKLPTVGMVLSCIVFLLVVNAALVFALFKLDGFKLLGIPFVYILVPVVFILETVCFIVWVIQRGAGDYDEEDEDQDDAYAYVDEKDEDDEEAATQISGDTQPGLDIGMAQPVSDESDWEGYDAESVVPEVSASHEETVPIASADANTVILPKDEIESILAHTAAIPDSATSFDFIQLNKDIRKVHRAVLKEKGITVTLRTPDKPIVVEMNKEDMWKAISMIYDNLEQYTEPDSRIYAEMYTQKGSLIYIVKNAVKAECMEAAQELMKSNLQFTGGLKTAKEIIEKNKGKFVVALDGNIFKTGIMISMNRE